MTSDQRRPVVGISISNNPDLPALGLDDGQLQSAMVDIAGTLLGHGADLAYGGDLRPGGHTRRLFELCGEQRRLVSYLAWPYYLSLSEDEEKRLAQGCRLVKVTPADAGLHNPPSPPEGDWGPEDGYRVARCLGRMRALMASGGAQAKDASMEPPLAARLVLGGKTTGFRGLMPGIFEETLLALSQPRPVALYVLGGFGGAARVLADALLGATGEDAELLTLAGQEARNPELGGLVLRYQQSELAVEEQPETRYRTLGDHLERAAAEGANLAEDRPWSALQNGLSVAENRELMRSRALGRIQSLLLTGLRRRGLLRESV